MRCWYPGHDGDREVATESTPAYVMTVSDAPPFIGPGDPAPESKEVPVCRVCGANYGPEDPTIREV